MSVVTIERKVLEKNDAVAARNRNTFRGHNLCVINLVSSPGAGKTSLLEQSITRLRSEVRLAVIEGDVQTDLDAQRIARLGVPAVQIVTRGGCHLEAQLVGDAMAALDLGSLDLLIIENVGNLVCPANYDLGEDARAVITSTTEGDDKPLKYPGMFRSSGVAVINKIDLLPYVDCDKNLLRRNLLSVNPGLQIFETSCRSGNGIDGWCAWLRERALSKK